MTLRAFVDAARRRRFFGLPVDEGLDALLQESADKPAGGHRPARRPGAARRRAADRTRSTARTATATASSSRDLPDDEVYRGAVTVMMRLVFLFVAEERRLLPLDDPLYDRDARRDHAARAAPGARRPDGEDVLEKSTAAWHRVLALFRAVHGGIEHDALRLPAYGGGLFDPDRYPFLEGRAAGHDAGATAAADPLPVDDRTVLHMLDALQTLDQGGGRRARAAVVPRARRRADRPRLRGPARPHRRADRRHGARPRRQARAGAAARRARARGRSEGDDVLDERLAKETGRSAKAIRKALDARGRRRDAARACAPRATTTTRCSSACCRSTALLRDDLRGDPRSFLAGSLYVTQALDRRSSGTYYTPRSLAEEVVQHALDPSRTRAIRRLGYFVQLRIVN